VRFSAILAGLVVTIAGYFVGMLRPGPGWSVGSISSGRG
jgi:hypothetical protein